MRALPYRPALALPVSIRFRLKQPPQSAVVGCRLQAVGPSPTLGASRIGPRATSILDNPPSFHVPWLAKDVPKLGGQRSSGLLLVIQAMERAPSAPIKTILLVDDGDECRVTTKWFLANFGYSVDAVRNAGEALALFNPTIHDLVVTDNAMPGMTGAEMAHVIKLRSPSTPVLMYSGNPPDDRSCLDLVIQRPTHLLKLREAVEKLLAEK
jgi:CheY-like chemotaxis protein